MIRLFVGLELPRPVKSALGRLCCGVDGARWQHDDQLHLTLRFIGEVEPSRLVDIGHSLETIAFPSFKTRLSGLGLFGKAERPRLLWAGVEDAAPLHHLHEKVDQSLIGCGIRPEERKFSPHVTLARMRGRSVRAAGYIAENSGFLSPSFEVAYISLFQSRLGNDGAHYEVLSRFPAIDRRDALYSGFMEDDDAQFSEDFGHWR